MIDGAVRVVASVRATETLVFVVRWEHLKHAVVGRVVDGSHVFAEGILVDVVRTRVGYQFLGNVVD